MIDPFRRVILAGTDFGNALVVNIDAVYSYCLSDIPNMGCHELTYTNISKLRFLGNWEDRTLGDKVKSYIRYILNEMQAFTKQKFICTSQFDCGEMSRPESLFRQVVLLYREHGARVKPSLIVGANFKLVAFWNYSRLKPPLDNKEVGFVILELFVLVISRDEELTVCIAPVVLSWSRQEVDKFSQKLIRRFI